MNVTPYWQKLQDPRWQRKRLEIMQRAKFACEDCGETSMQLHVHHLLYRKGCEPWDYEPEALLCLCEKCHAERHEKHQSLLEGISKMDSKTYDEFCFLAWVVGRRDVFLMEPVLRRMGEVIARLMAEQKEGA